MVDSKFKKLVEVVDILRGPKGCPWDRKQKVKDLKNYILEEVYELFDALDAKNPHLIKEELGDLFMLLVFFSKLFEEKNIFKAEDALENIVNKMIVRHPHVFARRKIKTSSGVLNMWIKDKAKKKLRKSIADRIPKKTPALFSSYLFIKECKHLDQIKTKDLEKELIKRIKKYHKHKDKKTLFEILFYSSLVLSLKGENPEVLLKKKVGKESSRVLYAKSTYKTSK
ncbi:MAG: nucleoside triphosphate pyrophosphohydrolase [Candidatus Omnitrophica bacterium]|nr:nucleoside triphosphate pyrophosphohydrolase [Candidatus Omnitrophota bacterium]